MLGASAVQVGAAAGAVGYAKTVPSSAGRAGSVRQALLALVYATVCAFRAILPRGDITKHCLVDSALSTPLVGRTLATGAEVSFALLVPAILERAMGRRATSPLILAGLRASTLLIVVAQACCWTGCLAECEFWNATEEAIWGVWGIGLSALCLLGLFGGKRPSYPHILWIGLLLSAGYSVYMFTVDVPMYTGKWNLRPESSSPLGSWAAIIEKTKRLWSGGLREAVARMNTCSTVTSRYEDWEHDLGWFTGYFIGAVWIAIIGSLWYSKTYGASLQKLKAFLPS